MIWGYPYFWKHPDSVWYIQELIKELIQPGKVSKHFSDHTIQLYSQVWDKVCLWKHLGVYTYIGLFSAIVGETFAEPYSVAWLPNVQRPTLQGTTRDRAVGKVIFHWKGRVPHVSCVFLFLVNMWNPVVFWLVVSNIFMFTWGNDPPIWLETTN